MKHLLIFGIAFAAFHICNSNKPECRLPEDEGHGTSFEFYVYYDYTNDKCNPFLYKGQGGNANRFKTEKECIRNCSANAEAIYPMDVTTACTLKKEMGKCNANLLRYYYDSARDKCKKFIWTGCMGNGNRFTDQDVCNKTCAGIHVDGEDPEEDEPDTPIAIICGVLLAVIVVSIFVTVIVLTLKSKNKDTKKATGKSRDAQTDAPLRDTIEMA
ncbi:BPTI/Kunitz domain-containing protein [Thunnus thynnus]|uniref:BPTI/Kunitz domain-containing protein n=1 Tax=Thunnus thynnus TaxID=8237 RepID=UPI00352916D8